MQSGSSRRYKILGDEVTAAPPTCSNPSPYNPRAWTVVLKGLGQTATKQDVTEMIPAELKPRNTNLSPAEDPGFPKKITKAVEDRLKSFGELDMLEVNSDLPGKRVKAIARFLDGADAARAVQQLNGSEVTISLGEIEPTPARAWNTRLGAVAQLAPIGRRPERKVAVKVTMCLLYTARLRVSEKLFKAVSDPIADANVGWKDRHLVFVPYMPLKGYRVLRIEGEDNEAVAEAKAQLEHILDGQVLSNEGKPLWGHGFIRNGPAVGMIRHLESQLGVTMICYEWKREIHYYGPGSKSQDVVRALLPFTDATISRPISLDQSQFLWAFRGGFRAISAAIPKSTVSLDLASTPRRLLVQGPHRDYEVVCRMLCQLEEVERATVLDDENCSICWTPAENPVKTRCGHSYCADCFEMLCLARAAPGKGGQASIACEGNEGKCHVPLPLDELESLLLSAAFEDLFETSFKAYVASHPTELRNCSTPDCDQVYRVTSTTGIFTCGRCVRSCCTACHVHHPGRGCNETEDDVALARAMSQLKIRKCPECGTLLQKAFGCNHMTCGGCRAHICWVCLESFTTGKECYGHMFEVHGSFVD